MSSALIGRRAELAGCAPASIVALGGFGHLVIVEGESGIGKTRLAQEALDHARRRRASVLRGRCYDHLDLPYLPLRDSLFVAIADAAASPGGPRGARAGASRRREPLDRHDAPEVIERERTRTLLAVTGLVLGYARTTPTVVFVDDVDWADVATIDLLRHLMFRLDDEQVPLLVLATSRADPIRPRRRGRGPPPQSEPRTAVVHLNPLTTLEATELAARAASPACRIDRARDLATASGGNPLLVEALVRDERSSPALLGRGVHAPDDGGDRRDAGRRCRSPTVAASCSPPRYSVPTPNAAASSRRATRASPPSSRRSTRACWSRTARTLAFSHPIYAHTRTRPRRRRPAASCTATPPPSCTRIVRSRTTSSPGTRSSTTTRSSACGRRGQRRAGPRRVDEAARYYEAALTRSQAPAELAELHRRAGLSRRGNLQLAQAVTHFEAALHLLGPDADAATRAELHLWRIRCAHRHPRDARRWWPTASRSRSWSTSSRPTTPSWRPRHWWSCRSRTGSSGA